MKMFCLTMMILVVLLVASVNSASPKAFNEDPFGLRAIARRSSCTHNGVVGGSCNATSTMVDLPFCGKYLAKYTSGYACVDPEGATKVDSDAKATYDMNYPLFTQSADCQTSYNEALCSAYFNQCPNGVSVGMCASMCENFLRACESQHITCTEETLAGQAVVITGTTGPSNTCTGAASSLIPSAIVGLLSFVVLALAKSSF